MVVRYGEGGIRTPDKAFRPYNGLANRRLQPLGHLSPERQRRQSPGLVQPPDPEVPLIAPDRLGGRFSTMILVVGATGLLGGEICRRLRERGQPVRALARHTSDPSKVQRLKSLGPEIVRGDLKDRASLDQACRGAATVISTASTTLSRQPDDSIGGVDQDGQMQLVDAAETPAWASSSTCRSPVASRSTARSARRSGAW